MFRKPVSILLIAWFGLSLNIGCKKPPSQSTTTEGGAAAPYDPAKDPLVNPSSVFEPLPEDRSGTDTEATLYLQLEGNPNTLNPLFASSRYDSIAIDHLFEALFTFDNKMAWKVNDVMVESYEESPDMTTFTVKLKPGMTWQDGEPFTAHDVVFSWKQILDDRVPCLAIKPDVEPITECKALDDLTVQFIEPGGFATARWSLLFPIIPKHLYEKDKQANPDLSSGDYYTQLNRKPIGNGAYRLVEWVENEKVVLERWDDYPGEKPPFKKVVLKIIPDNNMTLLSFEKGQVDAVEALSAQQFALETNSESFKKVGYKLWASEWSFSYIGWNMDGSNPFFHDKRVRYAMTHALNIPMIIEKVYYNLATPCHGVYYPESWMFNPGIKLLDYNLDKAAALLDESGWLVDPVDGWRYKEIDSRKVKFSFTFLIPQGSPTAPKIAAIYQEDLKSLGVEMNTHVLEWSAFLLKVRQHEFQAEAAAWGTGTDPDTGWNLWRSEQYEKGRNYGKYSNPRVDELFELGRKEFDQAKRAKIYQEIGKILYEDQPYTWICNRATLSAINKRIHGVQMSPRGLYNFDPGFASWWTPQTATMP